ncbi:putative manganese transporter [Pelagibius sp. Alg239-R121]|uniref:putative manganese transporter n=1 Tax=Pelagibius sp. Alg239-R121 TaxID=2993448 RepID=UPI0024A7214A|nr:putative manganese transporter [Pelagibius sp. Alg239-R121]
MTVLVASTKAYASYFKQSGWFQTAGSFVLAGLVFVAMATLPDVVIPAMADAYLQVSVFVATTLALFAVIESRLKVGTDELLERHKAWHVPVAAALGALPGCGGAVMVVTQFVNGRLSFGALVSVLTATMGDAAFLLLAQAPLDGVAIFALGGIVGTLSGYAVDRLHGVDFLRPRRPQGASSCPATSAAKPSKTELIWIAIVLPGLALGILQLLQIDVDPLFGAFQAYRPTETIGLVGAVLSILMWSFTARGAENQLMAGSATSRVIGTTNFVTVWVIVGFLMYEVGIHATGWDLAVIAHTWAPLVPLLAVLVGFLPGCGPQIVVTTLYLAGTVPLSAQLGNAISNDGDALFPALALAPRAAMVATFYSAVPAVMVAYSTFLLFE